MIDKIKEMTEIGFSVKQIAENIKLNIKDIQTIIADNMFIIHKEIFSEDKASKILDLYLNGISARNLGIKFGVSIKRIQSLVNDYGIMRTKNESLRKFSLNEHIFDFIDTQEKAYWLGFIYANSYLYEKNHRLTIKFEHNHLKKLSEFIGYSGKVDDYLVIHSQYLTSHLLANRLIRCKDPQFPSFIDKSLYLHFVRGLFDGDGSLICNKKEWEWKIIGNKEICENIQNIFKEYGIELKIILTNNTKYIVRTFGNLKIRQICDLLYHNSKVFFHKNYDKMLLIRESGSILHPINYKTFKFNQIISLHGQEMSNQYIKTLNNEEKEKLVPIISEHFIKTGFTYPDNYENLLGDFDLLKQKQIDVEIMELNNADRTCTFPCKYFCPSFYKSKTIYDKSMVDAFANPEHITKAVRHRLGLSATSDRNYNFSMQTMVDQIKNLHLSGYVGIFKPLIAKYMYTKYSGENDTVFDYSCGFGGRLLGAMSCNRKYIGTDPLTIPELEEMAKFYNFNNYELIYSGSEKYRGKENSVDLSWSSPPFYDLERYSDSLNQAYNKGEEYFYNIYWRHTLENVKFMLKPEKWFGVNVGLGHYKMVDIAKEYFGNVIEEVSLKSMRHHFEGSKVKYESIYMFRNNK